jgi:hypothetical protein
MDSRSDSCETQRFMASPEGTAFLEGMRDHLKGKTIVEVAFVGSPEGITATLFFNGDDCFSFNDDELSLATLYEQFKRVFEREAREDCAECSTDNSRAAPERR